MVNVEQGQYLILYPLTRAHELERPNLTIGFVFLVFRIGPMIQADHYHLSSAVDPAESCIMTVNSHSAKILNSLRDKGDFVICL